MPHDRELSTGHVKRTAVSPQVSDEAEGWTTFEAQAGETFDVDYDKTEWFLVLRGRVEVVFGDGLSIDLLSGDFVTIEPGVSGAWAVKEPLLVKYTYDR